jgi:hypothetical protein
MHRMMNRGGLIMQRCLFSVRAAAAAAGYGGRDDRTGEALCEGRSRAGPGQPVQSGADRVAAGPAAAADAGGRSQVSLQSHPSVKCSNHARIMQCR